MEHVFIWYETATCRLLGVCESARDAEACDFAEYDDRPDVTCMSVIAPSLDDAWNFVGRLTIWK